MSESLAAPLLLEQRPLVTFALFAYNQEKYVREAVEGAFAQTYTPLEIILSDDFSTDETHKIMSEMAESYSGPHKIILNRNSENLGLIEHVNYINTIANGDLIVVAAGDDISLSHRTAVHAAVFFKDCGSVHSIHSSVTKISEDGRILGTWRPPILNTNGSPDELVDKFGLIIGASHSWSRRVNEVFGPIIHREAYEDMIVVFRSSLMNGVRYIDEPLVQYRYNIGISNNQQATCRNSKSRIKQIHDFNVVCLAVTRQRLKDALLMKSDHLASKLRRRIVVLRIKIGILIVASGLPESVANTFFSIIKIKRLILNSRRQQ